MSPDEAITAAYRAAAHEIARGLAPDRAAAFEGFMIETGGHAVAISESWSNLAMARPIMTPVCADSAEMRVYTDTLATAVSALLTLAHFPHLEKIDIHFDETRGALL